MSNFEYKPIKKKLGVKIEKFNDNYIDKFNQNEIDISNDIDMINSPYIDLNPNVNLNATSLEDLDDFEDNQNEIINQDNIYVDPINKPLFLSGFNKDKGKPKEQPEKKSHLNMTLNEFFKDISNSYIQILDDLLSNNYNDLTDLLLKDSRGLAFGFLLIIVALFFVFFSPFE